MKKRIAATLLSMAMALGLPTFAAAYEIPDFSDVPASHWAYSSIMEMAEQGVIKGVGGGRFDPEGTVTAEMFLVLVGRVVFPDVQAQGGDWSGPYIAAAKEHQFLLNTGVTDETLTAGITRYDMAQVLYRAMDLVGVEVYTNNGIIYGDEVRDEDIDQHALADQFEWEKVKLPLTDLGDLDLYSPYRSAVLKAYVTGLMRGDQNGYFNGENTTTRMEAAAVIQRLLERKADVAAARPLRVELVAQELKALLPESPTQQELADAIFHVERRWALNLFSTGQKGSFTAEEQETIRQELGVAPELFRNSRLAAIRRHDQVMQAEQGTKELSLEALTTLSYEDLAWTLRARVHDLEPRDQKSLMDARGITAKDLEAAYLAAEAYSQNFNEYYYIHLALDDAADIAVTAATLAKEEGAEAFTFRAYGRTMRSDRHSNDLTKLHLGLYGEDGRLVGRPELDAITGWWTLEITQDTDRLDEVFTLSLVEPYWAYGYYLDAGMLEEDPLTLTMHDLIEGRAIFPLDKAQGRLHPLFET